MDIKTAVRAFDGIVPKKNEKYQFIHFADGVASAYTPELSAEIFRVADPSIRASVNHTRLDKALRRFEAPSLEWKRPDLFVSGGGEKYTLPVFAVRKQEWPVSVPIPVATLCRKDLEDLAMGMCTADETEVDQEPVVRVDAEGDEIRISSGTGLACATSFIAADINVGYGATLPSGNLAGAIQFLSCCDVETVKLSKLGSGLQMEWSGGRVHVQESFFSGFSSGKRLTQVAGESTSLGCSKEDLLEFFSAAAHLSDKDSDTIVCDPMGSKMRLVYKSRHGQFEKVVAADATGEPFKVSMARLKTAVKGAVADDFSLLRSESAVMCKSGNFVAAVALSV